MRRHLIYILVEGDDDVLLFDRVLRRCFEALHGKMYIIQWAQRSAKVVNGYIRTFKDKEYEYLFFADLEGPCVTKRKEDLLATYKELEPERVFVVIREIEGWYLAGLDKESSDSLGIEAVSETDRIGKKRFESLMRDSFDSAKDLKMEIIKVFSIANAKSRNASFSRLLERHELCDQH